MFISITGCSNQETKVVDEYENFATHEEYKSWVSNETFSFQTQNGPIRIIGELGSFGLIMGDFQVETENTYT